ncbi:hypothetical protein P3T35_006885 [Kitasatospora sp. GP30]|uniref:DUF6817 domain-containing protein n=1 Tax=Kitasatospora sp. GP30 TaxID=3035084 RepID=UPI000C714429|nr:hypothetical protein [Kitasatospora sp. GP30]MDH6144836.1 hypothetical protein [Kitasatospora sp. GP30]
MPDSPPDFVRGDPHQQADALLRSLGAAELDHPGGTLLAHLHRVRELLADWGARPELQLAGLCHACYGTDGFPTALLPAARQDSRDRLAAVIGPAAEQLVHDYAGCERGPTYRELTGEPPRIHDRFTGRPYQPTPHQQRDFAELTAANELDLARHSQDFRARHGAALLTLFTRWRPLLSEPAWATAELLLG